MAEANRDQINFWSTTQGRKWLRLEDRIERMMTPFTEVGLAALGDIAGKHCLDIGCGAAGTTLALADAAGDDGSAAGIDVSPPLLERARTRADGRKTLCFVEGDAQDYAFREDRSTSCSPVLASCFSGILQQPSLTCTGRASRAHGLSSSSGASRGKIPG